jgi:hypothetical protein
MSVLGSKADIPDPVSNANDPKQAYTSLTECVIAACELGPYSVLTQLSF